MYNRYIRTDDGTYTKVSEEETPSGQPRQEPRQDSPPPDGPPPFSPPPPFGGGEGIAGYLRLLAPGVSFKEASIGRVIAKKRRCGIGSKLMQAGIEKMKEIYGDTDIRIEAQVYAREFYEKAGFVKVSEEFLDDGIPHIEMLRKG